MPEKAGIKSPPESRYEVVDKYLGQKGVEYFNSQSARGITGAYFNRRIWQPYIQPQDDIMDFGCGGGYLLKVLEARRKIGVEINPAARATAESVGIKVFATLSEVTGKFNKIITSHTLEHLPSPASTLQEMSKYLYDEHSLLLILLPLDDWRSSANRRYSLADQNFHLYTWTPQSLGNLLTACSYNVIHIKIINHAWPPYDRKIWKVSKTLFHLSAFVWSTLRLRRQLFAVAQQKPVS